MLRPKLQLVNVMNCSNAVSRRSVWWAFFTPVDMPVGTLWKTSQLRCLALRPGVLATWEISFPRAPKRAFTEFSRPENRAVLYSGPVLLKVQ